MANPPSSHFGTTLFAIPGVAVARHPGTILAPRELRNWVQTLPFGNPPNAAQQLLQQLRLLVRDPEPGAKFEALLDVYEAPTLRLLEIVGERQPVTSGHLVPLDQLEHALLDLLAEFAFGRLRGANRLTHAGKPVPAALLFRAAELLDAADNIERLHFGASNTRHWPTLMAIFLHADADGSAGTEVAPKLAQGGGNGPRNVAGLFFRALVIGMCDPNHHNPQDVADWYRWIGNHTALLELSMLPQGPFSIPVDISGQASPLHGARRSKPGTSTRYLVTDAFLKALHDDAEAPPDLYRCLSDLIKGRKTPEQRQNPRQARVHPFRLSVGLHKVHARLSSLTNGTAAAAGTPLACVQINQSKTGAAFHIDNPSPGALAIGDVLLAETDNPKPGGAPLGFVGRIQRLVTDHAQRVEIGVEKLDGRVMPLTLTGAAADRVRGDNVGLLHHSPGQARPVLLVSRSVYRENDTATATCANGTLTLRMHQLLDGSTRTALIQVSED